ncbi:sensor histidine kinase [Aromatoleum diolicum]|uniref:histidine kinase n=1 Tax=Aromatoleum diolicum TaxID=75796 RepID=A0ABX1QDQ1_9RHOO|nr:response regulator [Aromatoleum diolicum]NMG76048.1 response regulator [Aromatoleum diolicum]
MDALPELRILLVEDDPLQSAKTVAFLESLGQKVLVAEDGDKAVEHFDSDRPDLVLMDVVLPGIDGFEATRRIKQMSTDRWVPVIYLTILGSSSNLVEGLHAGGDDYLVKPIELEILEAKLRSVMRTLSLYRALKDSRDELASMNAALLRANRELETFTYAVAHDLKSPLRAINGYSSLFASTQAATLTDEGHDYLTKIVHGTEQMGELIDDLLEYSRLERGAVHFERIDVQHQAEALVDEFRDEIERHGAHIDVAAHCREITADRNGLTLILRNLLGNALKFSANSTPPHIEIGCISENGTHRIWVRDNGIGFDMRHHDRIFDIFQRLHRSEDYPGTGIGLAIVRKAAQRMGGRCWGISEPDKGATFYVEWPIADDPHPAEQQAL